MVGSFTYSVLALARLTGVFVSDKFRLSFPAVGLMPEPYRLGASNGSLEHRSVGFLLRHCAFCCDWWDGLELCLDPIQRLVPALANGLVEFSSRLVKGVGRASRDRRFQLLLRWPRRLVLGDPLLQ